MSDWGKDLCSTSTEILITPPKYTEEFLQNKIAKVRKTEPELRPESWWKIFCRGLKMGFEILLIHLDWAEENLWVELQGIRNPLMCSINSYTLKTTQSSISVSSGPNTN